MELSDALALVDSREDQKIFEEAKVVIKEHLAEAEAAPKKDYEQIGTLYYYLLRLSLHEHMSFETNTALDYYEKLLSNFSRREKTLFKEERKERRQRNLPIKIRAMQGKAFFKLMERYFSSLEIAYDEKDFVEARNRAYETKMDFRKKRYFFGRHYFDWFGYVFLDKSCRYGNSFLRWGMTGLTFVLFFGVLYSFLDFYQTGFQMVAAKSGFWLFNYFYFSIVTFTTLGFGDITPITGLQKLFVGAEVFSGYIMLGMFVNLIQKKL